MPGIIYMYAGDGSEHACCAGIHNRTSANDPTPISMAERMAKPRPYVFALKHDWWWNRTGTAASKEEADFIKWRNHLEFVLPITLKEVKTGLKHNSGIYWQLPVVNYNQFVFIATLVRHPLEVSSKYVNVYDYMVKNQYDPFGTIVAMSMKKETDRNVGSWDHQRGHFYNSHGHGFGDVCSYFEKKGWHDPAYLKRLCMHQAIVDLETAPSTCGYSWKQGTPVGHLTFPRSYVMKDGEPPVLVQELMPKELRPKRKRRGNRVHLAMVRDEFGRFHHYDRLAAMLMGHYREAA